MKTYGGNHNIAPHILNPNTPLLLHFSYGGSITRERGPSTKDVTPAGNRTPFSYWSEYFDRVFLKTNWTQQIYNIAYFLCLILVHAIINTNKFTSKRIKICQQILTQPQIIYFIKVLYVRPTCPMQMEDTTHLIVVLLNSFANAPKAKKMTSHGGRNDTQGQQLPATNADRWHNRSVAKQLHQKQGKGETRQSNVRVD